MAQFPRTGSRAGIPQWSGPGVECATCGVVLTPFAVQQTHTRDSLLRWWWTIPDHAPYQNGFGPHVRRCTGSRTLLSAVAGVAR